MLFTRLQQTFARVRHRVWEHLGFQKSQSFWPAQSGFREASFAELKNLADKPNTVDAANIKHKRGVVSEFFRSATAVETASLAIEEVHELFPQSSLLPSKVMAGICLDAKQETLLHPFADDKFFPFAMISEALERAGMDPVAAHALAIKYSTLVDKAIDEGPNSLVRHNGDASKLNGP